MNSRSGVKVLFGSDVSMTVASTTSASGSENANVPGWKSEPASTNVVSGNETTVSVGAVPLPPPVLVTKIEENDTGAETRRA